MFAHRPMHANSCVLHTSVRSHVGTKPSAAIGVCARTPTLASMHACTAHCAGSLAHRARAIRHGRALDTHQADIRNTCELDARS
eukprot:721845-Alexandrium_andersonii.AAC.1